MNESKLSKKNLEKKGEKIGKKKNENLKVGHQGFRLTTGRAESPWGCQPHNVSYDTAAVHWFAYGS